MHGLSEQCRKCANAQMLRIRCQLSLPFPPPLSFTRLKLHDDSARSSPAPPPTGPPTIAVQQQRVPTWGARCGLLFIPNSPPVIGPSSIPCHRIRYEFYLLSVGILALIYRRLLFALLPAQQGAKYGNH